MKSFGFISLWCNLGFVNILWGTFLPVISMYMRVWGSVSDRKWFFLTYTLCIFCHSPFFLSLLFWSMCSWSNYFQSTFLLVSFFLCRFSSLLSLGYTLYNAGARNLFTKFNFQFTISSCNCCARSCDIEWCQNLKYRNGGKPFPNLICKLKLRSKSSTSCNVEL